MEENVQDKIEEFKKSEELKMKKKKRKKTILIFLLVILIIVAMYGTTVIVKKINVSKLGNEYCEYNGEHPVETGMKEDTYYQCLGCSKVMKFERTIRHKLCDTCAEELHRCKICAKLLKEE